ncbi:MAG: hypothetical protein ACM3KL_05965, partial [Alphaproteobacteria bacterium]
MAASDRRGQESGGMKRFDPRILDRSVIAIPLLEQMGQDENAVHAVIIDVNLDYPGGRDAGQKRIRDAINDAVAMIAPEDERSQGIREQKSRLSKQYIFARLSGKVIRELVRLDVERAAREAKAGKKIRQPKKRGTAPKQADTTKPYRFRAIYRIWPDFKISPCIIKSLATVKADAAQTSFCAQGTNITWAIMDSGIDAKHPHFSRHQNVDPVSPLHADFTDTSNVP